MEENLIEIDKIEILLNSSISILNEKVAEMIDNYKQNNYTCVGSDTTQTVSSSGYIHTTITLKFKKNC